MYQAISNFPTSEWPADGLQALGHCPLCESSLRSVLHEGLRDSVFFCAPGLWTMWRCDDCRSAYLDPRPTPETIHLAYANYYTHTAAALSPKFESLPLRAKIRRALGNGYRNWRYGTDEQASSSLGIVCALMFPWLRRSNDIDFRYLPHPADTEGRRVLDIGFGSGAFLDFAASAGWDAAGCDPDGTAVANARARGLNVRQGGIQSWADEEAAFDAITLSHVIEHVHDPVATIKAAFRLLRPGGRLYIETPNIDALGLRNHGPFWLGLDPPRHLVLFHWQSMERLLVATGFGAIKRKAHPLIKEWGLASAKIAAGISVFSPNNGEVAGPNLSLRLLTKFAAGRSEALTLTCRRPA